MCDDVLRAAPLIVETSGAYSKLVINFTIYEGGYTQIQIPRCGKVYSGTVFHNF